VTNLPLCGEGFCVRRLEALLGPALLACSSTAALGANNVGDPSAGTFTEAIERHQDESAEEAVSFRRLSHADKKLLLLFLRFL
jgi:hypothetical protein